MFNISNHLDKFKLPDNPKDGKSVISEIVFEETGIKITPESISVSRGVLKLNVSALVKNSVYIKKDAILNKIQERLPGVLIEKFV